MRYTVQNIQELQQRTMHRVVKHRSTALVGGPTSYIPQFQKICFLIRCAFFIVMQLGDSITCTYQYTTSNCYIIMLIILTTTGKCYTSKHCHQPMPTNWDSNMWQVTFTSTEQPIVQYGFKIGSEWQTRCTSDVFPTPVKINTSTCFI